MRIIQLIQKNQLRGAEMFACQLSNELLILGHQVMMLTIYKGDTKMPFERDVLHLYGNPKKRFLDISAWKKLGNFIGDFEPDIVQCNAGDTLKYAIFSKMFFKWKTPILVRNASVVGDYIQNPMIKALNGFFYKRIKFVTSVSKASEDDILKIYPFLRGRTTVIPIGVNISTPKHVDWQYKNETVQHIVHVGGFTFEKNHKGLIDIFRILIKKKPAVHLHLIGDGPLRAEIEADVKSKELDKSISFYGFVVNPIDYIAKADVLVLPSLIEGLPGVLMEAMSVKTVVVAYNVGGVAEIVNKVTGYLVEYDNITSFAESLSCALEANNSKKIDRAYHLISQYYTNKSVALKFEEVYKNCI